MWWEGGGLPAGALIVTVLGFGSGLATGWFVTAPVDWLLQRRRGAATADSYATPKYEQRWEVMRWGVALTFASVWVVLIWHALFDSGPVNSDQAGLPIWIPIGTDDCRSGSRRAALPIRGVVVAHSESTRAVSRSGKELSSMRTQPRTYRHMWADLDHHPIRTHSSGPARHTSVVSSTASGMA